jgi:cytochrome c
MNIIRLALCVGLLAAASMTAASAADRSGEADAIMLIKKAQEYIKTNGMDKAIVEFNNLESPFNSKSDINKNGDLYVYSVDSKGYQAVHGKNPKIRGKVMIEMKDAEGVPLIAEFIKKCMGPDGKGWVDYHWPHPISKAVEAKRGYVERIPGTDICIGTGVYK